MLQRFWTHSNLPSETNQQQNAGLGTAAYAVRAYKALERLGEVEWNRFLRAAIPFDAFSGRIPTAHMQRWSMRSQLVYHGKDRRLCTKHSDMSKLLKLLRTAVVLTRKLPGAVVGSA